MEPPGNFFQIYQELTDAKTKRDHRGNLILATWVRPKPTKEKFFSGCKNFEKVLVLISGWGGTINFSQSGLVLN